MPREVKNLPASIRSRLQRVAIEAGRPFQEYVENYCIERLLYRVSRTEHADDVIVKGAFSLRTLEVPIGRPTRDVDLLVTGNRCRKT